MCFFYIPWGLFELRVIQISQKLTRLLSNKTFDMQNDQTLFLWEAPAWSHTGTSRDLTIFQVSTSRSYCSADLNAPTSFLPPMAYTKPEIYSSWISCVIC